MKWNEEQENLHGNFGKLFAHREQNWCVPNNKQSNNNYTRTSIRIWSISVSFWGPLSISKIGYAGLYEYFRTYIMVTQWNSSIEQYIFCIIHPCSPRRPSYWFIAFEFQFLVSHLYNSLFVVFWGGWFLYVEICVPVSGTAHLYRNITYTYNTHTYPMYSWEYIIFRTKFSLILY